MIDLTTKYMGLSLKNPLIIGSCGLTSSVESIRELAENGAGAVVLKSLFEEQILLSISKSSSDIYGQHAEANDYIHYFERSKIVEKYLELIENAKLAVDIPVIASINCQRNEEWTTFAKQIEDAGADALELNIFILPSKPGEKHIITEERYFSILREVKKQVSIPVALKLGYHFTNLANTMVEFSQKKADALVLFNRFYNTDIDLDTEKVVSGNAYSSPDDYLIPLRWIAMLSGHVDCDLCASTGIHDGSAVIKQILAGASTVQMVSALYEHKPRFIKTTLQIISTWMKEKGYNKLADFRGKLCQANIETPEFYERVQFMQYLDKVKSPF
jgi:dihydroorotate dehydrogenase (fumarate)